MSRLAKKPTVIPEGVTTEIKDRRIEFSGSLGKLSLPILDFVKIDIKNNQIYSATLSKNKQARANLGTMAALMKNAITGVTKGFKKELLIEGVGFRAQVEGKTLVLNIGFSHPVRFSLPEGISVTVEKSTIRLAGINKELVGLAAAKIRKLKKPEPYKGKGIRYIDEVVRRKAGKKVAGTTTT